jgi:hypothetical protein
VDYLLDCLTDRKLSAGCKLFEVVPDQLREPAIFNFAFEERNRRARSVRLRHRYRVGSAERRHDTPGFSIVKQLADLHGFPPSYHWRCLPEAKNSFVCCAPAICS